MYAIRSYYADLLADLVPFRLGVEEIAGHVARIDRLDYQHAPVLGQFLSGVADVLDVGCAMLGAIGTGREQASHAVDVITSYSIHYTKLYDSFTEGGLRNIRWDDVEIVRGISYLLRDRDWGTIPATIEDVTIDVHDETFAVRFALTVNTPTGHLLARARIEGTP